MLCENCGERRAEIHLVKIINGTQIEEDICRECAEKMMPFNDAAKALRLSFSLEGIMNVEEAARRLLFPILPELYEADGKDMRCPHCGEVIDPDELFNKLGDKSVEGRDIIFDFSGAGQSGENSGEGVAAEAKSVARTQVTMPDLEISESDVMDKELIGLKKELEFVLRGERYERAAEIRDRIVELEKTIKGKMKEA